MFYVENNYQLSTEEEVASDGHTMNKITFLLSVL